ncbi:MAG: BLUF domain-containing protein [Burkholderiaceae bacterium]
MKTLLYVSELAEGAAPTVVGAIAKTARANNLRRGICGMLLFDGLRFAQLLEGSVEAIDCLMATLRCDQRHVNLQVLSMHECASGHRFSQWELGYLLIEGDEASDGIGQLLQTQSLAAEAAFLELASKADRSGAPI